MREQDVWRIAAEVLAALRDGASPAGGAGHPGDGPGDVWGAGVGPSDALPGIPSDVPGCGPGACPDAARDAVHDAGRGAGYGARDAHFGGPLGHGAGQGPEGSGTARASGAAGRDGGPGAGHGAGLGGGWGGSPGASPGASPDASPAGVGAACAGRPAEGDWGRGAEWGTEPGGKPGPAPGMEPGIGRDSGPGTAQDGGAPLPDLAGAEFRRGCFLASPHRRDVIDDFVSHTGARIAVGTVGTRPPTRACLRFLADHARSKGTVFKEVPEEWIDGHGLWAVSTLAGDKDTYLTRPDLGRLLSEESLRALRRRYADAPQVLIVLSDGLSTDALLANYEEILPPLQNGLRQAGIRAGAPLFLRHGRVKAEDRIGEAVGCDVVVMLVGERPGLGQSESMSCYAVYRPTADTLESDRSVISNIHREGTPPVEAAAVIVDLVRDMLHWKASGIRLNRRQAGGAGA